jgi:hypothetical protein
MPAAMAKRWPLRGAIAFAFAGALLAGGLSAFVVWNVVPSGGQLAKRRALCDQAVSTLLTTTDQLELQRAGFIVRQLDCSITRRL